MGLPRRTPAPPAGTRPGPTENTHRKKGWGTPAWGGFKLDASGRSGSNRSNDPNNTDSMPSIMDPDKADDPLTKLGLALSTPAARKANRGVTIEKANESIFNNDQIQRRGPNDLGSPGVNETFYDLNKDRYEKELNSQSFYDRNKDFFEGPTRASQQYDQMAAKYGNGGPSYMQDAWNNAQGLSQNLDPYYSRAFDTGMDQVNRAAAARGMFGSSGAMRSISDLSADLNAERANREGQYGLDRASLLGSIGSAASQDELNWATGMHGMAQGADQSNLELRNAGQRAAESADTSTTSRLTSQSNAAASAQQSQINRLLGVLGGVSKMDEVFSGISSDANNQATEDWANLSSDEIAMRLGIPREVLNQLGADEASKKELDAMLVKIAELAATSGGSAAAD